jgi:hypothetical protein
LSFCSFLHLSGCRRSDLRSKILIALHRWIDRCNSGRMGPWWLAGEIKKHALFMTSPGRLMSLAHLVNHWRQTRVRERPDTPATLFPVDFDHNHVHDVTSKLFSLNVFFLSTEFAVRRVRHARGPGLLLCLAPWRRYKLALICCSRIGMCPYIYST